MTDGPEKTDEEVMRGVVRALYGREQPETAVAISHRRVNVPGRGRTPPVMEIQPKWSGWRHDEVVYDVIAVVGDKRVVQHRDFYAAEVRPIIRDKGLAGYEIKLLPLKRVSRG